MYCTDFIFDQIRASDQGFMIVSFGTASETANAGSKIEFTTISPPGSSKWFKTSTKYSEPLSFSFSIAKNACSGTNEDYYFTSDDISFVMRWLIRNEYHTLNFLQDEFEDICFICRLQADAHLINGHVVGFDLTGTCDAPFGYGKEITLALSAEEDVASIYDSSDEIGTTYPYMEITCRDTTEKSTTIMIENITDNETTMIQNCIAGEVITIDQNFQLTTSEPSHETTLANDFNFVYFHFGNTFKNRVTKLKCTNCDVVLRYRPVRKVVC